MNITGNEEIETAIPVVVAKTRPRGPVTEGYAGCFSHVGKGAVVIVVVKAILAVIGHVEVGPAIIVIVAYGHAKTPPVIGDARLRGHVR